MYGYIIYIIYNMGIIYSIYIYNRYIGLDAVHSI